MPVIVTCTGCGAKLTAPDSAAGKRIRCPKPNCGTVAAVPALVPALEITDPDPPAQPKKIAPVEVDENEPKKPKRSVALDLDDEDDEPKKLKKKPTRAEEEDDRPTKKKRRRKEEDDEYDEYDEYDRPARRKKKKTGVSPVLIAMVALVGLLGLGGVGYGIYALAFQKKEETAGTGTGGSSTGSPSGTTVAPTFPAGWEEYRSEQDKFKMMMGKPVKQQLLGKGGREYKVRDDRNKLMVAVAVTDIARDMSPELRKAIADEVVRQLKRNPQFKNVKERQVQFLGQSVPELTVDLGEARDEAGVLQKATMLVRVVTSETKGYTIMVGGTEQTLKATSAEAIFDSFAILK